MGKKKDNKSNKMNKKKQQVKENKQAKQKKQDKQKKQEKEPKTQEVQQPKRMIEGEQPKIYNIPQLRNSDRTLRIGMLTSGGDCQALNATMRGVVKGLFSVRDNIEIYGFQHGYKGLIYSDFKMYTARDFSGILTQGGTILGTSRMPFKEMRIPDKNGLDKVEAMKQNYYKLQLDCLVMLGGNGSTKSANMLSEEGLNVVSLPKTIDNDLWATDYTFGFQSAVDVATDTIDRLHTTATSHNRVFVVEIMGHDVGWIALYSGIAGGADIVLLPEMPYDMDVIMNAIEGRKKQGKLFTIVAVAEGAISKEDAKLSKKELKKKQAKENYPSAAYEVLHKIQERTDLETRIDVPGYTQRGGDPDAYDRVMSTRLGVAGSEAILDGNFGVMMALQNGEIVRVPLSEVAGKLKYVDPNSSIIREAKLSGICFGDK